MTVSVAYPKAVLFDWDNTLVDSWSVIQDALNHTLGAFDKPLWSLDETRTRVRKSMRDSFPKLFGDDWEKAGQVFYQRFEEIHVERLQPLPGAADMLAAFRDAGLYMGVVSNKKGPLLRKEAAHLGWDIYFDRLVGADDAASDKPSAAPVQMALDGSGIEGGEGVWFVGDADVDLECAANAGCAPILVRPEPPENGEFSDNPPAAYVKNPEELCKLLLTL